MASVYRFVCDAEQIISQIIKKDRELQELRNICQHAALQIQRVWRGHRDRQMMRYLHASATMIQKLVKGYFLRKNIDKYIGEVVEYRRMKYRNKMATRIQALWKGYWYRCHVLNVKQQYATQKRIERVNAELVDRMQAHRASAQQVQKAAVENKCMEQVLFILFKIHHHLRTAQREGVFSLHGRSGEYSWIETLLKNMKFTNYMKILRQIYSSHHQQPCTSAKCLFKGRYAECEKAYRLRDRNTDPMRQQGRHEPPPPSFVQPRPFCFDPKINRKLDVPILTRGPFTPPIRDVARSLDAAKNICNVDFILTGKMADGDKPASPPYYVDFWDTLCQIHNIPDN